MPVLRDITSKVFDKSYVYLRKVSSPSQLRKTHDVLTKLIDAICRKNHDDVYVLLLDSHMCVDCIRENHSWAPIHYACKVGDLDIVKTLLEYGADASARAAEGLTPLKIAALCGHFEVAEYLVSRGASDDQITDGFQIAATDDSKIDYPVHLK